MPEILPVLVAISKLPVARHKIRPKYSPTFLPALEQALNHPTASFIIWTLEDWQKNKRN